MDRELFTARLATSAEAAWAVARATVSEDLPARLAFRVRLNQSYDGGDPQPGQVRYPADSAPERAAALHRCDAATVVAELWRDGRVPEWIDVAVVGETGDETLVELVCSGRFTDVDARLGHPGAGAPPFHVVGPVHPPWHDGGPFSIHTRAECWDATDLAHLRAVAGRVWSFDLRTDAFDADHLRALPDLPHTEIFEHRACTLGRHTMSAFARFPKLRLLRLHLAAPSGFHVSADDDHLATLTDLTITRLPSRPWGHGTLSDVAPALTALHLTASGTLWWDGTVGPSVRHISLAADTVAGPARLPNHLDHLSIRLGRGGDHQVAELLDGVVRLTSLSLRGTPVSDAILPVLERCAPRHLDLVDTAVTASALARFRAGHPETDLLPRTPPFPAGEPRISGYDRA